MIIKLIITPTHFYYQEYIKAIYKKLCPPHEIIEKSDIWDMPISRDLFLVKKLEK